MLRQLLKRPLKNPSIFSGNFCHLTFNFALSVDNALSAGMAGVGLTIPTGSLWLAAMPLIPNVARLTGTASEGALEQGQHIIFTLAMMNGSCYLKSGSGFC